MTASPKRVPARYFALLLGSLGMQGVDTAHLLRLAALDAQRFERGDDMLTPAEIESFLVAASHVTERTDLGFEMGRLIKLNSHDQLGYGMLSCRDLDQLLRLTSRYYHLIIELFTLRFRRTPEGGEAVFNPVAAMPLRTMRFAIEAIAVSVQNQFEMLLGPPGTAFDFYMGMPPPPHQARYLELLPARFHFDERALPASRCVSIPGYWSGRFPWPRPNWSNRSKVGCKACSGARLPCGAGETTSPCCCARHKASRSRWTISPADMNCRRARSTAASRRRTCSFATCRSRSVSSARASGWRGRGYRSGASPRNWASADPANFSRAFSATAV